MAGSSLIYEKELIIREEDEVITPVGKETGLTLGLRSTPYGQMASAPPFPRELVMSKDEQLDRIKDLDRSSGSTRLSKRIITAGLPCPDQASTNYCWINAPTHCVEIMRLLHNLPMQILSPASAGARIKNFRNVGGWGEEGLQFIVENGLCPVELWPANAIDRKYDTPANREAAKKFRVTEWWELVPRDMDQLVSVLLMGFPVAVGYNWWGHEVTAIEPVIIDGQICIRIRNSWGMSWGDKGFSILQGKKMFADDAVVARVTMAS
jgi:hypothetical protein